MLPPVMAMPQDELDAWVAELEGDFVKAINRAFMTVGDLIKFRSMVAAADDPPGEPYVSLDDASAATTAWRSEMVALTDKLRSVFEAGAYGLSSAIDEAVLPEGARGYSVVPEVINEAGTTYLAQAENRVKGLGDVTWQETRNSLTDGFQAGESIEQLSQRVQDAAGFAEARARTVARTETIMAAGGGAYAQAISQPDVIKPKMKEWLATEDWRTRESHSLANEQRQPLDSLFAVGGSALRYPGDPSGPAEETVNCRCTVLYHLDPVDAECS